MEYPFRAPAIKVTQPIGTFYVTVLPAELLLQVASSDAMSATLNVDGSGYALTGTQRLVKDKRLAEIAGYIDRIDSAFPNSIILAANFDKEVGLDQEEVDSIAIEEIEAQGANTTSLTATARAEWTIIECSMGCYQLSIPTADKLAAIIDGQHRLFAFARANRSRLSMQLICAVFLDLPKPIQAQLFATINSTQKAVDRSLTFELFGYNVSDEDEKLWTPDKLAVFLTRKLGTEESSPLRGRITVAPKRDEGLEKLAAGSTWFVSTAVVVDGILRLISSNPKRDANAMHTSEARSRSALGAGPKDKSPLREAFVSGNDSIIYKMVENYLEACNRVFWHEDLHDSFIVKTVGVQALFDVLRTLASKSYEDRDVQVAYFEKILRPASSIDFSAVEFRVPSGSGRSIIRNKLKSAIGL
jgi:DNA phosphorothioation-associated DGQHR protein 1